MFTLKPALFYPAWFFCILGIYVTIQMLEYALYPDGLPPRHTHVDCPATCACPAGTPDKDGQILP